MNIAYIHSGFWPSNSPSVTFVTYNAVGLSRVFDKVFLFIKQKADIDADQVFKSAFALEKPDNLILINAYTMPRIKSNYLYFSRVRSRIQKLFRKEGLDALVTRSTTFLPFMLRLKERLGLPVFYETHDFFADLSVRSDLTGKNRFRQSQLERAYIPGLSGLFCLQESQIEWYRKSFPGQNFHLLRTGIYNLFRHPMEGRNAVAYIGSLDFHKGIEVLLNALNRSESKPHLLLIGGKTTQEMERLQREAARLYQAQKVTVTGWVNKEQLHGYLQQTALGIIPLRDTFFNRYLTSPLKLFDYYSFGIPVIASDLPTTRSLITENDTGFFFQNEDSAELAARIDRILGDRKRLERMSNAVYEHAESYLWEKRAERMYRIVKEHTPTLSPLEKGGSQGGRG